MYCCPVKNQLAATVPKRPVARGVPVLDLFGSCGFAAQSPRLENTRIKALTGIMTSPAGRLQQALSISRRVECEAQRAEAGGWSALDAFSLEAVRCAALRDRATCRTLLLKVCYVHTVMRVLSVLALLCRTVGAEALRSRSS